LPKLNAQKHSINELNDINAELVPLKEIADRELASIYGLRGMVYTPHLDTYMQVCIKKAAILVCLKKQGLLPLSEVELISTILDDLHKGVKNKTLVEHKGNAYVRRFTPLKLSKSGKTVQRWARFWLLKTSNGDIDASWESQVREIWPSYFVIRGVTF
jgi:hypothetical protein